jgi:GT2 family glycosyltransferase
MLQLSVVVPTYNRVASLRRMLEALARQTIAPESFEVLVVDDGSTDGTPALVRLLEAQSPFRIRLLHQAHAGPAQARNLGVAHAAGDLVLFLDDDVLPLPDLLLEHLQAHAGRPDTVVVGPMLPPINWSRPGWVRWEERLLQVQYRELVEGKYPCTPRQFYTANASLSRRLFHEAHGFDPAFLRAEDVELAYRLRDLGARFIFTPSARVLHYAARSFAAWCRGAYLYGRYDVVMTRDKGHEALTCATREFHTRHPLSRLLVRCCLGRPPLCRLLLFALPGVIAATERLGLEALAACCLSSAFGLLYWQGASDELGGRDRVWTRLAASAA